MVMMGFSQQAFRYQRHHWSKHDGREYHQYQSSSRYHIFTNLRNVGLSLETHHQAKSNWSSNQASHPLESQFIGWKEEVLAEHKSHDQHHSKNTNKTRYRYNRQLKTNHSETPGPVQVRDENQA